MSSYTKAYDLALRALLHSRYATLLGLNSEGSSITDQIDKGIIFYPKDIALRMISEKRGKDYLSTSFISLWRTGQSFSWERNRTQLSRLPLWVTLADGSIVPVKSVPMNIQYYWCLWTQDLDLAAQICEDYSFWQQEYPRLDITFDNEISVNPEFHLGEIYADPTVEAMFQKGKYFVYQFPLDLDAWVFKVGEATGICNKIQLNLWYKDDVINYPEIYVPDSNQDTELANILKMDVISQYLISGLDFENKIIVTPDDRTDDFLVGTKLRIEDSTSNNLIYTIANSTYDEVENETLIYVEESFVDDTVDGYIVKCKQSL